MTLEPDTGPERDDPLDEVVLSYEKARDAGLAPDPRKVIASHPDLADRLADYFANQGRLDLLLAPPALPSLPPLEKYEIQEWIGDGGQATVYKVRHLQLKRTDALKMIRSDDRPSPQELARLRREAEALAALKHPNIVQIHDIAEHDGRPYLLLEFVEGGSLARQLDGTPWSGERAARLLKSLARAIHSAHAHQLHIVHRDLKPGNVLLTADGEPKIADFGLAKLRGDQGLTQSNMIVGTYSYMAPEQAEGRSKEIGPATDVYALGAILYELLTGRPPFRGATPLDTMRDVVEYPPAYPSLLNPHVDPDLEAICLKCLEKQPRDRYPSAEALAGDLERHLNGEPPIHGVRPNVWALIGRVINRPRHITRYTGFANAAFVTALVFFAGNLAAYALLRGAGPEPLVWLAVFGPYAVMFAAWGGIRLRSWPVSFASKQMWIIWGGNGLAGLVIFAASRIMTRQASYPCPDLNRKEDRP